MIIYIHFSIQISLKKFYMISLLNSHFKIGGLNLRLTMQQQRYPLMFYWQFLWIPDYYKTRSLNSQTYCILIKHWIGQKLCSGFSYCMENRNELFGQSNSFFHVAYKIVSHETKRQTEWIHVWCQKLSLEKWLSLEICRSCRDRERKRRAVSWEPRKEILTWKVGIGNLGLQEKILELWRSQ